MIKIYLKNLLYIILLSTLALQAKPIDITKENISLITSSEIYLDSQNLTFSEIQKNAAFKRYPYSNINIGIAHKNIWLKLTFHNSTTEDIEKIMVFGSPFLEHILLYAQESDTPVIKGMAHDNSQHHTLQYYHTISVPAQSQKIYYVKVYSDDSPVSFTLTLKEEKRYVKEDLYEQLIDIALIGFIIALMLYSLFVGTYLKEMSYIHYGLYLLALIYFQLTYLGFIQTYASYAFVMFTLEMSVIGPLFLVVTTALFAISFLKIGRYPKLYKGYIAFIILAFLSMFPFSEGRSIGLVIMMALSFFLIVYTIFVAVYVYRKGYKQAQLYIVGFGIVLISYVMIIGDALGFISVMQHMPNILLWTTALESLILSLAFADQYMILQEEKALINAQYLKEANQRESLVQIEVDTKTEALNAALDEKELLLQEVHHRVKNNLQIILSIIQLKGDELEEEKEKTILIDLENRINAIAKTYETLIVNEDLKKIDMQVYTQQLLEDMQETFAYMNENIEIDIYSNAKLPLKESVYVGLIINELVTNAYKYAFDGGKGKIIVSLEEENNTYRLLISDDGKGFIPKENSESLGLTLMDTLVRDQLKGALEIDRTQGTRYLITFDLD